MTRRLFNLGDTDHTTVDQEKRTLNTTLDYYENILTKQDYLAGKVRGPRYLVLLFS